VCKSLAGFSAFEDEGVVIAGMGSSRLSQGAQYTEEVEQAYYDNRKDIEQLPRNFSVRQTNMKKEAERLKMNMARL
jgi:hypothetical protein